MKRRSITLLLGFATTAAAIAFVAQMSASPSPASAIRPAPADGGSTAEFTFTPTVTPTPCPTDKFPIFEGTGCGTATPTPTSVRVGPMVTIDFTVNGSHNSVMVLQGQLMSVWTVYHNEDHRGIYIDDSVDFSDGGHSTGHCFISPGSSCSGGSGFSADHPGLITAMLRLTAQVDGCTLCPTLEKEHSIPISVIARGDFNCGGTIDSIDAALILQLTAALIQPFPCTGAGDVNDDGLTNAVDAFLLLQYVAGLIPLFT
jgi:hypothetical protein